MTGPMTPLVRTLTDRDRRNRALWTVPCWALTLLMFGLGGPYLGGGIGVVPLPQPYEAVQHAFAPIGGMRFYGGMLCLFGLSLFISLTAPLWHHGRRLLEHQILVTMSIFVPFAAGAISGFAYSESQNHVPAYQFIVFWTSNMLLAIGTIIFAPNPPRWVLTAIDWLARMFGGTDRA